MLASFEDTASGARLAALADAGVAQSLGAESIELNPAGIVRRQDTFDLVFFYAKPFGLDELNLGTIAVRYSWPRLSSAASMRYFGNNCYHESLISSALSFELTPNVSIGCAGRYGLLSIFQYHHTSVFLVDLGAICSLGRNVKWAFSAKNVNCAKIGQHNEPLARILMTGLSISQQQTVVFNLDVHKDTRFPFDFRCGVTFKPVPELALRAGVGNEPVRFCLGFSIAYAKFRIDYAYSSHSELGGTHMFAIGIS